MAKLLFRHVVVLMLENGQFDHLFGGSALVRCGPFSPPRPWPLSSVFVRLPIRS